MISARLVCGTAASLPFVVDDTVAELGSVCFYLWQSGFSREPSFLLRSVCRTEESNILPCCLSACPCLAFLKLAPQRCRPVQPSALYEGPVSAVLWVCKVNLADHSSAIVCAASWFNCSAQHHRRYYPATRLTSMTLVPGLVNGVMRMG